MKRLKPKTVKEYFRAFWLFGGLFIVFSTIVDSRDILRWITLGIGAILCAIAIILDLVLCRCPYCNGYLRGGKSGEYCPHCGREIP